MARSTIDPSRALDDPEWSLPMKLLRAREAVLSRFRGHLRNYDLTDQQWRIIRVLGHIGTAEMLALSARCCIQPPSLSRTIPKLEERGLITRSVVINDQRRVSVSLTRKGKSLFEKVGNGSQAIYASMADDIGAKRIDAVFAALDGLLEALSLEEEEMAEEDA